MDIFVWDPATKELTTPSIKHETVQPFLFLSFIEFSGAKVILDIGANGGLYSLISTLSHQVESVYAFETDKASYSTLKKIFFLIV